jgi:MoxR-like ATPase
MASDITLGKNTDRDLLSEKINELEQQLNAELLGQEQNIRLLLLCLMAGGHALIQGDPGLGKTSLAKNLAESLACNFSRIQFTPDLLPADILGYSMFDPAQQKFNFIEGPIFSNIVLADEINRTSSRVQSALLECMNEGQVSVDGKTHSLTPPFMVVATQNHRFQAGTYKLPEPQLDRFLISIHVELPDSETQEQILKNHQYPSTHRTCSSNLNAEDISLIQDGIGNIKIGASLRKYIVCLCDAVRKESSASEGHLSVRASLALMRAAQACAFLNGREVVYPEDIKFVFIAVIQHRLSTSAADSGEFNISILQEILDKVALT